MKKNILLLFAALLPLVASAQTKVEIDGIWYNLVSKIKQAEVTYKGEAPYSYNNEYSGSITIPATVTYNGVECSVTSIENRAFDECSGLTAITIPESVTSIGVQAFFGCSRLTSITIPEDSKLTSIESEAFLRCSRLTAITLPESVTSIGDGAFRDCSSLTAITLPESVTYIGNYAFQNCSSLTSINIPEGVMHIGSYTFSGCSSLTNINIPEGVTGIGSLAFQYCSSLTSITIPGVTSIRSGAFQVCSSLTTLVLPKSVWSISDKAFFGCPELTDVYCYAERVPSTSANAFDGSFPEYATLHVPERAVESYKSITPWSNFGKIVPLTEEEAAISNAQASLIKVQGHHGTLRITGATEGDDISVYTTDGTLVTQESAEGSETQLTLPTGQVYIVTVADKVVKIGM